MVTLFITSNVRDVYLVQLHSLVSYQEVTSLKQFQPRTINATQFTHRRVNHAFRSNRTEVNLSIGKVEPQREHRQVT